MVLGPSPATAGFLPMAGRLCYATVQTAECIELVSGGMGVGSADGSVVRDGYAFVWMQSMRRGKTSMRRRRWMAG